MRTFLLGVLLYIVGLMLCVSLLFAQQQEARMSLGVVGGGVPAAGVTHGNIFWEDFEGSTSCFATYSSNCQQTFSAIAGTPDFDYGTTPYGGSYCLRSTINQSASITTAKKLKTYTRFWIRVAAHDSSQEMGPDLSDEHGNRAWGLRLNNTVTHLWELYIYDGSEVIKGSWTYTPGTWHKVEIMYDSTGKTFDAYFDDAGQITAAITTPVDDVQTWLFGIPANWGAGTTVDIDDIEVDNATFK